MTISKSLYPSYVLIFFILLSIIAGAQNPDSISVPSIPYKLFWENSPAHFENNRTNLVIEAGEKTDMFRDPNVTYNTDKAPKLLFVPDSNFILTVSIKHDFTNKWDGGAIVLKSDSLNWIKFCFEKDYTGAKRVVSVVTKNISDDCNSVASVPNIIFYKVAKAGNVITLYYSNDGKSWFLVRHLQFDFKSPLKIKFYLKPEIL
jgi:regulation of enolase protein 1 (concanavalin A-like superfamily)